MLKLNPLKRNVLITTDEVIFHGGTKQTLDNRMIEQSIIVAEERIVRPVLGLKMYMALVNTKNKVVTDANKTDMQTLINADNGNPGAYQLVTGDIVNSATFLSDKDLALWNWILWKLTAEAVMLCSTPEGFVQFSSAGVINALPPGTALGAAGNVSPSLASVKWSMDKKMQIRIDPLIDSMRDFICATPGDYPLYGFPCANCDDREGNDNNRASNGNGGFVMGIYDDQDREIDGFDRRRGRCCD